MGSEMCIRDRAGIGYLVAGEIDPDPRHGGRGLQALVDAGHKV